MNRLDVIKRYGGIFLVAAAIIVFYKLFDSFGVLVDAVHTLLAVLTPVVIGAVLAYFLSPIATFFERKFAKGTGFLANHKRLLSVLLAFLSFILIIVIIVVYLSPIVADSVMDIASSMTAYLKDFEGEARKVIKDENIINVVLELEKAIVSFVQKLANVEPTVYINSIFNVASRFITWLLGLVFCPYILIERDTLLSLFDRVALLFISKKNLDTIHSYTYKCHKIFGDFVFGKFIDSVIIGLIALVGLGLLGLQFFPFLALVILVTNMVPYFGPFIGGAPVALFALLTAGVLPAVWTTLFIFALQQFDGLILGPAILGESVGISPFWIILSITLFGGLFGFIGMFLGVPMICIIRMFFNDYLAYRKNKDMIKS